MLELFAPEEGCDCLTPTSVPCHLTSANGRAGQLAVKCLVGFKLVLELPMPNQSGSADVPHTGSLPYPRQTQQLTAAAARCA